MLILIKPEELHKQLELLQDNIGNLRVLLDVLLPIKNSPIKAEGYKSGVEAETPIGSAVTHLIMLANARIVFLNNLIQGIISRIEGVRK